MPALSYSLNFASSCNFGLRLFVWYHDLYMMIAVIGYGFHPMKPFVVIVTLIEFHVCFFPSFCWLPPSSLSSSFWKKILLPTACEFVVSGKSTDMILSLLISLYFPRSFLFGEHDLYVMKNGMGYGLISNEALRSHSYTDRGSFIFYFYQVLVFLCVWILRVLWV